MRKNIMGWALAAALVGCGGSGGGDVAEGEGGEGHAGGEHGGEHGELPAEVTAFHDALAPVWHAEEGQVRRDAACENIHVLDGAADDVEAMSVPEGVDENAWHAATDDLMADVDVVAGACEGDADDVEAKLSEVHDAFHAIVELLNPEEHEGHEAGESHEGHEGHEGHEEKQICIY